MSPKLSQVLVLLTAVTSTLQRKLVSDDDGVTLSNSGLQNLVEHLETHAYPNRDNKPYLGKQRSDLSSLLNIETLNLYIKDNKLKKDKRSGLEEDRICKLGRCRCKGNRCGCKGDRCKNYEDYSEKRNENHDERNEDRNGRNEDRVERNEYHEETNEVQQILNELEKELDKDPLRCTERCDGTGRCGCRGRPTRSKDREENQLRCRYGRCGKHRPENNLKSQLEQFGKKYKISDDLDAIVVDISNFEGLLGKLNGNLINIDRKQDRKVDIDYLYGDTRNFDDRENDGDLDAVVLNLGQTKDEELVSKVVDDLLYETKQKSEHDDDPIRPNELAEFFEANKQRIIGNALNFVRNSRGDKNLSALSKKQQYQLQKVRSEVQRLGAKSNLKEVERKILDIVLGNGLKSKVLPHNEKNNNVFIPTWVYRALKESRDDLRSKRLFPLTIKQKMKMYKQNSTKKNAWRRNLQNNANGYGVPFQLQVQGLGQVNL